MHPSGGGRPNLVSCRTGIDAFRAQAGLALGAPSRCDRTGVGSGMCRKPLFARTGTVI